MTESKRIKLSDTQIRVIIFLFILAVFVIINPKVINAANIVSILNNMVYTGILALGLMPLLVIGVLDLGIAAYAVVGAYDICFEDEDRQFDGYEAMVRAYQYLSAILYEKPSSGYYWAADCMREIFAYLNDQEGALEEKRAESSQK